MFKVSRFELVRLTRQVPKMLFFNFRSNYLSRYYSSIRIGCASGFWGDTAASVPVLLNHGNLDFLVFDYLSEITMSLLAAAKQKSPDMGYTSDFIFAAMAPNMQSIKKQNVKVISNAGGINPHSCAKALKDLSKRLDLDFKIAVVTGDDLLLQEDAIRNEGITDMKKGFSFPKHIQSMNAYLGGGPIAKALDDGADIVITGRCVDSALVLGPLLSTFRWKLDDWDKLAAGSLAGHLVECGSQSTGGIHTDWQLVPDMHNIGFPIVECESSGKFIITKPSNSGGRVSVGTVAEQMLYEIDDPENYHLPDVTCDFSNVTLKEISENVIAVDGAKGKVPSDFYKVSATFNDGYRATAVCPVMGPHAVDKARKTAESILKRSQLLLDYLGMKEFRRTHLEILGSEQCYGRNANANASLSKEVILWLAVHHDQQEAVKLFTRELAAAATGGAPGFTNLIGGRPRVSPIFRLFSFLYPKDKIKIQVTVEDKTENYNSPKQLDKKIVSNHNVQNETWKQQSLLTGSKTYRLSELAYLRSGDKGDTGNIGVIARHPSFFPYIEKQLTADVVRKYFEHVFDEKPGVVKRYFLPGVHAFNFVLEDSLGGGGVASLRSDPQGKAYGQILSDFVLREMPSVDRLT